jgi:hypothetical protein
MGTVSDIPDRAPGDFVSVVFQLLEKLLRYGSPAVVPAAPRNHLQQQGHQIDASFGKTIDELGALVRVAALGDYARTLQALEPVGQDVRRNSFAGRQELAEGFPAFEDQVSNDEQGPPVSEEIE